MSRLNLALACAAPFVVFFSSHVPSPISECLADMTRISGGDLYFLSGYPKGALSLTPSDFPISSYDVKRVPS